MIVIGITGGIGSGKSQVLELLRDRAGVVICSADKIGREVQQKGTPAYRHIVEAFGRDICLPGGELDRTALSEIVFKDSELLDALNAIVHPAVEREVRARMAQAEADGADLFLLESAILLDVGYQQFCDEVWFLYVPLEERIERLKEQRAMDRGSIICIARIQRSDESYRAACDVTIDNSGPPEALEAAINSQLTRLGLDRI